MSGASARGRSWSIAETKALCVAAKNASEQGTTDEKELEARVRANFKERLLYMERIGTYPGGDPTLPTAQQAVEERLGNEGSQLMGQVSVCLVEGYTARDRQRHHASRKGGRTWRVGQRQAD